MDNTMIKFFIRTSTSVRAADNFLNENFKFKNTREKITFLTELFDFEPFEASSEKETYKKMLSAIIH